MPARPTTASVAKELKLSRWLFGPITVVSGVLAVGAYYALGERVAGGWIVATCIGALAWALVSHFGKQLSVETTSSYHERSNNPVNADARGAVKSAEVVDARAGYWER